VTAQSVHRSSLVTSQSPVKQPCFTYTSDPNDALQHSYDMLCSTAQPRARHLRHSCIELCLEGLFELSQSLHLTLPQLTRQPPATSAGLSYDFRQKTGQSLLTDFISVLVVRCARRGLRNMWRKLDWEKTPTQVLSKQLLQHGDGLGTFLHNGR